MENYTKKLNKIYDSIIGKYYHLNDLASYQKHRMIKFKDIHTNNNSLIVTTQNNLIPGLTATMEAEMRKPDDSTDYSKYLYTFMLPILTDISIHCIQKAKNHAQDQGLPNPQPFVELAAANALNILRPITTKQNILKYGVNDLSSEEDFIALLISGSNGVKALTHYNQIDNDEDYSDYVDNLVIGLVKLESIMKPMQDHLNGNDKYVQRLLNKATSDKVDVRDSASLILLTILEAYYVTTNNIKVWERMIKPNPTDFTGDEIDKILNETIDMLSLTEPARVKVNWQYDNAEIELAKLI